MPITAPPSWIGTILALRWSSRLLLTFSMAICRHSLPGSGTIALDSGHGLIDAIRKFMQLLKSIRHDNCWVKCWSSPDGLRSSVDANHEWFIKIHDFWPARITYPVLSFVDNTSCRCEVKFSLLLTGTQGRCLTLLS